MVAGAYMPLAVALMVSDPDAADRVIDEGIDHIRRARSPAFSVAFIASLRARTALMRGDAERAVALALELGADPGPRLDTLGLAYALLTLNDCVIVCGALAALGGRLERASTLLAAVADRGSVRTPELWAVYLHYRRLVRAGLDIATIRRCREAGRAVDLDRALDEEIAHHGGDA